jgi:parvulin-like peptidyl-prolyl isomerase
MTLRTLRRIAAAAGLAVALAGALSPRVRLDRGDAAAVVNDVAIPRAALERAAARLGVSPDDAAARDAVLARLVDEELLVQRAGEIGLVDSDREIRKALVRAAIDRTVDAAPRTATEAALRTFHAANADFFRAPRRLHLRALAFPLRGEPDTAARRAADAHRALAGGAPFDEVARKAVQEGAAVPVASVADEPLPEPALRRALGPTLAEAALALDAPGAVSAPVRAGDALHVVLLVDAQPAHGAPFEDVRDAVEAEWRRRAADEALAALLARLRRETAIVRAHDAPPL